MVSLYSYKSFQTAQLECVRKYPQAIKDELERYDQEVCTYFAVERTRQPKKVDTYNGRLLEYIRSLYKSRLITQLSC